MPTPAGGRWRAGTVFLQVVASFDNVQADARREGGKAGRNYGQAFDEALKASLQKVGLLPDESKTEADARKIGTKAGKAIQEALRATLADMPAVDPKVDTDEARRKIASLKADLESVRDQHINADLDDKAAMAKIDEIKLQLRQLGSESPNVSIGIDAALASAQLTALHHEVNALDRDNVNIKVDVDGAGAAAAELETVNKNANSTASATGEAASAFRTFNPYVLAVVASLPMLASGLSSAAGAASLLGVAMGEASLGVGAMILGFSGIGNAVQALIAENDNAEKSSLQMAKRMNTASRGVRDAEIAMSRAREQAADSAADAARRIQDANRSIADAERSAARATRAAAEQQRQAAKDLAWTRQQAAQQAKDAERAVADAREQSAAAIASADEAEKRAEKDLATAQESSKQAQLDLIEAREKARQQRQQLANEIAQGKINEQQDVLNLFDAQTAYNAAMADPGATEYERQQAQIALEQAKLSLREQRQENENNAKAKKKSDKEGIDGSDLVKTAQQRLNDAIEREKTAREDVAKAAAAADKARVDGARRVQRAEEAQRRSAESATRSIEQAQQRLADANRTVAETAGDNARSIAAAKRGLADAQREAARTARSNAESISDAQRRLTDAQADYQAALKRTGDVGSSQMLAVKNAMAVLSPEGRKFARYLFSLRKQFYDIRDAAQDAMLPGVRRALQMLVSTYAGDFTNFVGKISAAVGGGFVDVAKMLTNKQWQGFFKEIAKFAPGFFRDWLKIGEALSTGFTSVFVALLPFAKQFMDVLAKLAQNASDFLQEFAKSPEFMDFMKYLKQQGPIMFRLLLGLGTLLIHLVEGLSPFGDIAIQILNFIIGLLNAIPPKLLGELIFGLLTVIVAMQVFAGVVAALITSALAASLATWIVAIAGVAAGIILLAGAFIIAWRHSETFRKIVKASLRAIGDAAVWLWEKAIKPASLAIWAALKATGDAAVWLWEKAIKPVCGWITDAFHSVATYMQSDWDGYIYPILKLFGYVMKTILWNGILKPTIWLARQAFHGWWKVMKWEWDHVLHPVFTAIGTAFKWLWDKVLHPTVDAIGNAFSTVWSDIADGWTKLARTLAKPLRWVIENVMNDIVIKGFNRLADFFEGKNATHMRYFNTAGLDRFIAAGEPVTNGVGSFALGGIANRTPLRRDTKVVPGYAPDLDRFVIEVGGGEAIMRPEFTQAAGHDWVYRMNAIARRYGPEGVRQALLGGMQGFANGGVAWPLPKSTVGTPFGQAGPMWSSGYHTGQDFVVPVGTPVHAMMDGLTKFAGWSSWGGNLVKLAHRDNMETWYAHNSKFLTHPGKPVMMDEVIALSGATGNVTGPHSHVELHVNGKAIDPMRLLNGSDISASGGGLLSGLWGKLTGLLGKIVRGPKAWITGALSGAWSKASDLLDSPWGRTLKGIPTKLVGGLVSKIASIIGVGDDSGAGLPTRSGGDEANQRLGHAMMLAKGWGEDQWAALKSLWIGESGWNERARNPSSGAYGIPQSLPASKMASAGRDWATSARTQIAWGLEYIKAAYGDPVNAYRKWLARSPHWYGAGSDNAAAGPAIVGENGPEAVWLNGNEKIRPQSYLTIDRNAFRKGLAQSAQAQQGFNANLTFHQSDLTARDVVDELTFEMKRQGRGGKYSVMSDG